MTAPLWKREFNGAARAVARRPWMVPLVFALWVILVQVAQFDFPAEAPISGTRYWPQGGVIGIWGPQAMLVIAMVGMVAWRVVSGRRDPGLALCLISPREIALAKTFAPTIPTLIVIGGITALESVKATQEIDSMILWRLGLHRWYAATFSSNGFELTPNTTLLMQGALVLRTLILGLVAVTLTTWMGLQIRNSWMVMLLPLAILGAVATLILIGEHVVRENLLPLPTVLFERGEFNFYAPYFHPDQIRHLVIGNTVMMSITRLFLPLLWLAYWWRWTSRGFAKRYFAEG